jgi:hypothetical protein
MILDATHSFNHWGFGRSLLDQNAMIATMDSTEYLRWAFEAYSVKTRKQI